MGLKVHAAGAVLMSACDHRQSCLPFRGSKGIAGCRYLPGAALMDTFWIVCLLDKVRPFFSAYNVTPACVLFHQLLNLGEHKAFGCFTEGD